MVACLLSHQNGEVRRIDGSGGDGGRDCQFEATDGVHAYEMKGFSGGRVGKTQRRQVERSLERAASLNPSDWTLITPVDPTPVNTSLGNVWIGSSSHCQPASHLLVVHGPSCESGR
jgi:hypothetical protein